jgi:hypothetical protein
MMQNSKWRVANRSSSADSFTRKETEIQRDVDDKLMMMIVVVMVMVNG